MNTASRTVLIVEDSPVQALALQQLLEDKGLRVLHAAEASTGIVLAEKYVPDAIVLDIEMPIMDGIETCRRLKANPLTRDVPIVILTAHGKAHIARQGLELGAADFIPKDAFSDKVLLETLRQLGVLT